MNFFKSVFSDDPDPESEPDSPTKREEEENPDENTSPEQSNAGGGDGGVWSFGGLMKTLATRSESVIETYRRDLQEFGSGLKKEIEVAQGSLGTVGNAIDEFGSSVMKGTAQIIAQGKEAILAVENESDSSDNNSSKSYGGLDRDILSSKPYSRFEAQVRAVQGDVNTYSEEPDDLDDFTKWKSGFDLDQKAEELGKLFEENVDMRGIYDRVVPDTVDHETFWLRYFYKVHKLKHVANVRAKLVRRAISQEDEEELTWDIDDDDDEDNEKVADASKEVSKMELEDTEKTSGQDIGQKLKDEVGTTALTTQVRNVDLQMSGTSEEKKQVVDNGNPETKPVVGDAAEAGDMSKSSGVSRTSSQPFVQEEEDLGWDEIEDLSSIDEKEVSRSGISLNRAELHKRLSAVEDEEEDLNWDIEDDDEPIKA